jgi:hypothetical protein
MKQKFVTGGLFALLVVAGALTASALAGMGPLRASQTTTTVPTTVVTTTTAPTTTTETTTTTTPAPPRRVTICHHVRDRKGFRRHATIRIARRAWTPHMRHGDSIGGCRTATAKKFHNRTAHKKKWHKRRR